LKAKYDYIIAGAGCAGLSLAMHMIDNDELSQKKVLIIDRELKLNNDRTWCFWEKGEGLFESIVYKRWEQISFNTEHNYCRYSILPYQYKMIRGIDFYNHCLQSIKKKPNFELVHHSINHLFSSDDSTGVMLGEEWIAAEYVFNSIPPQKPLLNSKEYWLWQHFKGWLIQIPAPHFDDLVATIMDFRVQGTEGDSAFCYVLPLSPTLALVEYTLFSHSLLDPPFYEKELLNYINSILGIKDFEILEVEEGKIPMTNYNFDLSQNNIINIGTNGGQTKGSTGYTFNFIQKHSKQIIENLLHHKKPLIRSSSKFRFYDSILLRLLDKSIYPADLLFDKLFSRNKIQQVFKFLDNESDIGEDLRIISSLPFKPFLNTALGHLL